MAFKVCSIYQLFNDNWAAEILNTGTEKAYNIRVGAHSSKNRHFDKQLLILDTILANSFL